MELGLASSRPRIPPILILRVLSRPDACRRRIARHGGRVGASHAGARTKRTLSTCTAWASIIRSRTRPLAAVVRRRSPSSLPSSRDLTRQDARSGRHTMLATGATGGAGRRGHRIRPDGSASSRAAPRHASVLIVEQRPVSGARARIASHAMRLLLARDLVRVRARAAREDGAERARSCSMVSTSRCRRSS